jgi:facilitated trehalose transporter
MPPLCALAGALLIGYPMQRFGRRTALIGLSVPFFLGFILMGFTYLVKHKAILFIGRLMSGLMNGAATPASQIYVMRQHQFYERQTTIRFKFKISLFIFLTD